MLKEMKAYAHLKPGQDGTKQLVEQYGEKLLCVRYGLIRGTPPAERLAELYTWRQTDITNIGNLADYVYQQQVTYIGNKLLVYGNW